MCRECSEGLTSGQSLVNNHWVVRLDTDIRKKKSPSLLEERAAWPRWASSYFHRYDHQAANQGRFDTTISLVWQIERPFRVFGRCSFTCLCSLVKWHPKARQCTSSRDIRSVCYRRRSVNRNACWMHFHDGQHRSVVADAMQNERRHSSSFKYETNIFDGIGIQCCIHGGFKWTDE